jgi:hypothetical protein
MSKRILTALLAAATFSFGSMVAVVPASAQSLEAILAACAVEGAVEADCTAAIQAYIAATGLPPGPALDAVLAEVASALAEANAPVSATAAIVAGLNVLVATATPGSTVQEDIIAVAAVVDERDTDTGSVTPV